MRVVLWLMLACGSAGPDPVEQALGDLPYTVSAVEEGPTAWEREQLAMQRKRAWRLKATEPLPGASAPTFLRFVVTEETYATPALARARLERLHEPPPDLSPSERKAFPLRQGRAVGRAVLVVSTDVAAFEPRLRDEVLDPLIRALAP